MPHDEPPLDHPAFIGAYKLINVLGEGGMGVVYLAEQTHPVRRRVALKILKPGMDSRQVLARFDSERQALAVMDHPNIARALDGGMTEDGRPFFVMELVHGTPITAYADMHRLTTTERLGLFLDVCRAVQHAHQKGVIHRDLKPSNVLVSVHDSGPVVKVIDFGIAKAVGLGLTERTLVTRAGQILGTPEYMSPEQAEMSGLDVDTRTDVYSLGVMLYELIVGALPFDLGAKPDYAISHTLREHEAPRPSARLISLGTTVNTVARYRRTTPEALRREIRGDLDWIILKAMDKDRTRRYDTANGLAMDIERHLEDQPVLARPPSTRDRVLKFARRNRAAVAPAAVAVVALLAGTGAAVMGQRQALVEKARAEEAAATAQQVSDFLVGLFRISDPGEARGNTITAREVLDRGSERIRTELVDQPAVQLRLLNNMGTVYRNLGLYDEASSLFRQAIAAGERAGVAPDPALLVHGLEGLAIVHRIQGRYAEAETALHRAAELKREQGGTETVDYASLIRTLASVHMLSGRYDDAKPLLHEALAIQERLMGPDNDEVGITLSNLSTLHLRQRQLEQAEPFLRRAIQITERIHGGDHPYLFDDLINLGGLYSYLGRKEDAEAAWLRAYSIGARILDADHPRMAHLLHNLGEASFTRGDLDEAEARFARALEIKERSVGPDNPSVALTLKWIGNLHTARGRYQDAEASYVRALDIYDQAMDLPDADVVETMERYAAMLEASGQHDRAATIEARAAEIRARLGP